MTRKDNRDARPLGGKGPLWASALLLIAVAVAVVMRPSLDTLRDPSGTVAGKDAAGNEAPGAGNSGHETTADKGAMAGADGAGQPVANEPAHTGEAGAAGHGETLDGAMNEVSSANASDAPRDDAEQEPASASGSQETREEARSDPLLLDEAAEMQEERLRPSFDEVRLDDDGVLIVAGRAVPGDEVELLVDGNGVATVLSDGRGKFAAVAVLPQVADARVLTLRARGKSGETMSLDEVILAPRLAQASPRDRKPQGTEPVDIGVARQPTADAPHVAEPTIAERQLAEADMEMRAPGAGSGDTANNEAGDASARTLLDEQSSSATDRDMEVPASAGEGGTAPAPQTGSTAQADDTPTENATGLLADPAPQIAILKSDADGVHLVQPDLAAPDRVALDTIGYSESGVVQLSGRASIEAQEIRVYLDNRAVARLPLDERGNWRGDVPDVATGVYTLRVDAVDSSGAVTSRIETPFKREAPATLAAADTYAAGPVSAVTVQTGDTLWAIARERYGEGLLYVRVFDANRDAIRNPDLIYPGQVFDLPEP